MKTDIKPLTDEQIKARDKMRAAQLELTKPQREDIFFLKGGDSDEDLDFGTGFTVEHLLVSYQQGGSPFRMEAHPDTIKAHADGYKATLIAPKGTDPDEYRDRFGFKNVITQAEFEAMKLVKIPGESKFTGGVRAERLEKAKERKKEQREKRQAERQAEREERRAERKALRELLRQERREERREARAEA